MVKYIGTTSDDDDDVVENVYQCANSNHSIVLCRPYTKWLDGLTDWFDSNRHRQANTKTEFTQ